MTTKGASLAAGIPGKFNQAEMAESLLNTKVFVKHLKVFFCFLEINHSVPLPL